MDRNVLYMLLERPPRTSNGGGFDRLAARVVALRAAHPDQAVEVWAKDEARLGLKPIARRVWSLTGHRPVSNGQSKFESLYVFGFTHPATGRVRTTIQSKANTDTMGAALADFAGWADPDRRKLLVVVADNAGWHVAGNLAVPPNVVLHHLPSCTPELQPAEPLWPLVREALANKTFPTLVALREPLGRRCEWLAEHPEVVKGAVGFHWAVRLG
jgi:transposase